MIPRYAPADLAALFSDEARFDAMLEVELLAVEAFERSGIAPRGTAARAAGGGAERSTAAFVADVDAPRGGHAPRHRGLRRRRPARAWRSPRRRGCTTASPRRTSSTPRCASRLTRRARRAPGRRRGARLRRWPPAPARRSTCRSRGARTGCSPSRPRSARSSRCCACRRSATACGSCAPARHRRRQALRARSAPTRQSIPAIEAHVCAALGLVARARDPGARPGSPRRGPLRVRGDGDDDRGASRTEVRLLARSDVGEAPSRSRRARRARRRCRTSATPSAPSGCAGWHASCAATSSRGSRTSRSGTSATSRTARVERVVLPDAIQLTGYLLREATSLAAGLVIDASTRRGEPRGREPRARLLPVGAARARRRGGSPATPRTGSSSAPHGRGGHAVGRSARCSRPMGRCTLDAERPRRRVRPRAACSGTAHASSTRSRDCDAADARGAWTHLHSREGARPLRGRVTTASCSSPRTGSSAFDVVMPSPSPNKGRVLTAMTSFWCDARSATSCAART